MSEFSAAPALLGYLYQVRVALLLLLERPEEAQVFIESLDDVALEEATGEIELVQTKLHIKRAGSLTDRSPDLWKTIRVWSTLIRDGSIDVDQTSFRLMSTSTAPAGSVAAALRPPGALPRDESTALQLLRTASMETANKSNSAAYGAFNALSMEQQARLISKIEILDSAESITNLKERILKRLELAARAGFLNPFFERLQGWWFDRVIHALVERPIQPILRRELVSQIDELRESFQADALPIDFLDLAAPAEEELPEKERVFIEQLRMVVISNPRIRDAIRDYYRAYVQRSRWLKDGLLLPGDLEKYENRLTEEWRRHYDTMMEDVGDEASEEEKRRHGRGLFRWCEQQADIPIRRSCTEKYVMRGSYHLLANDLKVGWHADFLMRLAHLVKRASTNADLEPENA